MIVSLEIPCQYPFPVSWKQVMSRRRLFVRVLINDPLEGGCRYMLHYPLSFWRGDHASVWYFEQEWSTFIGGHIQQKSDVTLQGDHLFLANMFQGGLDGIF